MLSKKIDNWIEQGRAEGVEEGRAQGEARGEAKAKLAIALALIGKGLDKNLIAEATGLSVEEIARPKPRIIIPSPKVNPLSSSK